VQELRIARAKAGMTLMELEAASGVGASTISKIERGVTHPQAGTLHKLADALDVEIAALLPPEPKVVQGSAHFQVDAETFKVLEALASGEISVAEAKARLDRVLEPVLQ
jgi:transcriptional regulator with XRE-family HTH domain